MRHQDGVFCKLLKSGKYGINGRLPDDHLRIDAVDLHGFPGNGAQGINQLFKSIFIQQAAVDNPKGSDGQNFISLGRFQPGGLHVKYRISQLGQKLVVKLGCLPCTAK